MIRIHVLAFLNILSLTVTAEKSEFELWNEQKTVSASCSNDAIPICEINTGGVSADVSQVTYANLGKLGIAKPHEYEKIVTFPVEWLKSNSEIHMVKFETQAWHSGQRYTITEPVLVKNGKYTVR